VRSLKGREESPLRNLILTSKNVAHCQAIRHLEFQNYY
jgi:hypothetical protein